MNPFSFITQSITIYVLISLISYLVESVVVLVPTKEINSLYDLFVSTNGSFWIWNSKMSGIPWDFSISPCSQPPSNWQGISCNCLNQGYQINCNVIALNLYGHNLNGKLPYSLGNLSNLVNISLARNRIFGKLPSSLYMLQSLKSLNFDNNKLTGSLSNMINQLKYLNYLSLSHNRLSGSLPISIGNVSSIKYINLNFNNLIGTIPSSFFNLTSLKYLFLSDNYISGSISSLFRYLHNLVTINMNNNKISGSIPEILQSFTSLVSFTINYNSLTNTIPFSISKLFNLQILDLSFNILSGALPSSLGYLSKMQNLTLKNNYFTSTIPISLGLIQKLRVLNIRNNLLAGTLSPLLIKNMTYLFDFKVNNNLLTGTMPYLGGIRYLEIVLLNNNLFVGNLNGIFNYRNQTVLTTILIAYNQLTGTIPSEIFLLPRLNTFIAGSNCFTNLIPLGICRAESLVTLSLDGMESSTSCRQLLATSISSSYTITDQNDDSIPSCIFNLTNIKTLHITGNSFRGDLPNTLPLGNHLVNLALSYNLLYGSIPITIQKRKWEFLDLSYNRFTGVLSSDFAPQDNLNTNIDLELNRLSDIIPNALLPLNNIHILSGNVFSCNYYNRKQSLPQNDPDLITYECGSNSFNFSAYIWIAVTLVTFCFVLLFRSQRIPKYFIDVFNTISISGINDESLSISRSVIEDLPSISLVKYNLNEILKISFFVTIYTVIILLPIYGACSLYYGTYEYLYGFVISGAFISGLAPFIIEFIALNLLIILFLILSFKSFARDRTVETEGNRVDNSPKRWTESTKQRYIRYLAFWVFIPFFNFTIVGGVNLLYIYLTIYQPSSDLIVYQLLLAVFKAFWNGYGFRYISRFIFHYFPYVNSSSSEYRYVQLFVTLVNNIAIPCILVAIVSKDCLYNVFITPDAITTNYEYIQCSRFQENSCLGNSTSGDIVNKSTDYIPPFYYSYQCSSRFITFYAPAFMYLCIIITIVNPVLQTSAAIIDSYVSKNRANINKFFLLFWDKIPIPRILKSFHSESTIPENLTLNPYFDCSQVFVNNFSNISVLMTFGVLFPPVGIALMISIYCYNYFTKWTVRRFLIHAVHNRKNEFIDIIGKECTGFYKKKLAKRSIWLVTSFCCCFYSVFLFDNLGDSVGFRGSYWVLIFMCLSPFFYYFVYKLIKYIRHTNRLPNNTVEKVVEQINVTSIDNPMMTTTTRVDDNIIA